MENKEKLSSLVKYQTDLKDRLDSKQVPVKHTHRVKEYKAFLSNELRIVSAQIDRIKLGEVK